MTDTHTSGGDRTRLRLAMIAFVLLAGSSIALLELSHRRMVHTLRRTVSAVDNLTHVRLRIMQAHLAADALEAGDPTFDPTRAPTELDRALDLLDDWRRGRSSLLEMEAVEPLRDPELVALTDRYVEAVRDVREELEARGAPDPVRWRLAFDELDDRAAALERQMHSALREDLRAEERRHRIRLAGWTAFLLAVGVTLGVLGRGRRREQEARLEAERAQMRAERRYANLASLAAAGIVRTDGAGVVREATRWWEERVGPVEEDPGRPWWAMLPEAEGKRVEDLWRDRAPRRRPFSVEVRHVDGEGRQRWLLGRWAPVRDAPPADGNEWVGTFVDDSERKAVEEQLHQSQKLEAIGRLTGTIAHDFNNLLTVIMGNLDVLRADEDLPPAHREVLGDIEGAARGGRDLVQGLLGFSRRSALSREPLELSDAVGEMVRLARRILPASVTLEFHPGPAGLRVHADRRALQQILLNLVTNARDAMTDGGRIVVAVDGEDLSGRRRDEPVDLAAGRYGVLTVADDGTGMDPETMERIFEPFFTTKSEGRGTGLGLASVHGLVRQHGGHVHVESEPGEGTTFRIYLPGVLEGTRGEPSASEGAAAEPSSNAAAPEAPVPSRTGSEGQPATRATPAPVRGEGAVPVLLVEDEESLRRTASRVLRTLGYRVTAVASGEEALEALASGVHADVVVSDVAMPGMDGVELYRALREQGDERPFLFTTGFAGHDVDARARIPPGSPFLPKPWTIDELSKAVDGVVVRSAERSSADRRRERDGVDDETAGERADREEP